MIPNHYLTLRVTNTSSKSDIKKAYRKLALEFHPDRNRNSDAHEKFIEINEAYLILSDEEARIKYDREFYAFYKTSNNEKFTNNKENFSNHSNQDYKKTTSTESIFKDEDLNYWTKNARKQAEEFANMAFNEFSKLLIGVVKETGFQLGNSILLMLGAFLSLGGCGNIVIGLTSKGETGNPLLGLIFLSIGIFIYKYATNNYEKHKN